MTSAMNAMPFGLARRIFTSRAKAVVARVERQQKAEPKTEKWEDRLFKTTTIANAIMGGIFGFFVSATAGAAGYTILTIPIGPVVQFVTTAGCFAGGALACIVPGRPRESGVFAFLNRAMQNVGLIAFSGVSTIAIFLALTGGDQRTADEVDAANIERAAVVTAKRDALSDAREVHGLVIDDIATIKTDIEKQKLTIGAMEREYEAWDYQVRNEAAPKSAADNAREDPQYAPRVGKKAEIALAKTELAALRASMKDRERDAEKTLGAVTSAGAALTLGRPSPASAASVSGFFAPAWAIAGKALGVSSQTVSLIAAGIASWVIVFSPIFKAIERGREATRVRRDAERTTRATVKNARKAAKKETRRSIARRVLSLFRSAPEPTPQPKSQKQAPVLQWPDDAGPAPVIRSTTGTQKFASTGSDADAEMRAVPTAAGCPDTQAVIAAIKSGDLMHVGVTTLAKFAGIGASKAKRVQASLVRRGMAEYTANGCTLIEGAA